MSKVAAVLSLVTVISVSSLISSCSTGGQTLGDLKYKPKKEKAVEFEKLDYKQVREEYQEILSLFKDKELKEQIERRIANVYMLEGEEDLLNAKPSKSYYTEAIKSYHEILKKYPNSPDNAQVLYQLARAYDMDGHTEKALKMLLQLTTRHPQYKNNAEAFFRIGDIYFGMQKYRKAQQQYKIVTEMKNDKLRTYAHYMLAWTYYKQFNYEASVNAYAVVLSLLLGDGEDIEGLSDSDKPLLNDSIESISLALAKSEGAQLIEKIPSLRGKPYKWRIYDSLGDYYLKKERFEDSADTFRRFVQKYNFSIHAPDLHSKLISAYIKGKFPLLALQEKEVYVDYYGLTSKYQKKHGIDEKIKANLKIYFDELASYYHNQAQELVIKHKKATDKSKDGKQSDKLKSELVKVKSEYTKSFGKATYFYAKYIEAFTNDPRIPEMYFLKAEAYYSINQYPNAIADFEKVAYHLNNFEQTKYRAKAGYAAIVAYQSHIKRLSTESDSAGESKEAKEWQAKAVDSMLKFAEVFHKDKRSPSVLTNAAEYLFGLDQYQRALAVAQKLITNNPKLDRQLKKTAYGIIAHSYFKLEQFVSAEKNYVSQRLLVKKGTKEYVTISERLATAIYKDSEILLAADKKQQAINQLLKIKRLTPDSKARVSAQYNAATLLLATKQWAFAIVELKELIRDFPKDKTAFEFSRKLAFAYEKQESWKKAADSYLSLSKNDKDEKIRQDALFIAAGLYEKTKNYNTAINLFKQYARTYEKPFEVRMEARFRLAELYGKTKEISKQLFWLRRIVDGDKKAGDLRTERSQWLAAWAHTKYGDYFASEFHRRKLTIALDKTLPKKNKALTDATNRYKKAADFGILEFVTMSSVKIAGLYQQLGKELRNISLPKELSKEQRGAYQDILEEQAAPLDQLALELHQGNIERAWNGEFNEWIDKSFIAMKSLSPERYDREEVEVRYGDGIR